MRSGLGIAISAGKFDLIDCGSGAEEGQALHELHPAPFYRRAFDAGGAAICQNAFLKREVSTTGPRTSTGC
jgi:hypothetical protein